MRSPTRWSGRCSIVDGRSIRRRGGHEQARRRRRGGLRRRAGGRRLGRRRLRVGQRGDAREQADAEADRERAASGRRGAHGHRFVSSQDPAPGARARAADSARGSSLSAYRRTVALTSEPADGRPLGHRSDQIVARHLTVGRGDRHHGDPHSRCPEALVPFRSIRGFAMPVVLAIASAVLPRAAAAGGAEMVTFPAATARPPSRPASRPSSPAAPSCWPNRDRPRP